MRLMMRTAIIQVTSVARNARPAPQATGRRQARRVPVMLAVMAARTRMHSEAFAEDENADVEHGNGRAGVGAGGIGRTAGREAPARSSPAMHAERGEKEEYFCESAEVGLPARRRRCDGAGG